MSEQEVMAGLSEGLGGGTDRASLLCLGKAGAGWFGQEEGGEAGK